MFTFNNSLARAQDDRRPQQLMLRLQREADNCVRSLRAGNVLTAKKRLEASVTSIAKLGSMMEMRISPAYHELRNEELELTADYLMKVQEEKEEAREERERLREERKVEASWPPGRQLDKERSHLANALTTPHPATSPARRKLAGLDEPSSRATTGPRTSRPTCTSSRTARSAGPSSRSVTRRSEPADRIRARRRISPFVRHPCPVLLERRHP
jgi:hypothetical protein